MEPQIFNPMGQKKEPEFKTLFDVVNLPSKGIFYPVVDGKHIESVYVEHMTALDEQLLLSPNLVQSGKAFDLLIQKKVKDPEFKKVDMLTCDRNAILMFLRMSAYGPYYDVNVTSPFTGEVFKATVDLQKIVEKELNELPNESNEYIYTTKDQKHVITFKILTHSQEETIREQCEAIKKVKNGNDADETPLKLMVNRITSLDSNPDKSRIQNYIYTLKPVVFKELVKAIEEVTPGLVMRYEYTCPSTGKKFLSWIPITSEFFYPSDEL
jgi:hypothetical protein